MSFRLPLIALALAGLTATAAFAQTAPQPVRPAQPAQPARPATPATPATPAAPARPAAPAAAPAATPARPAAPAPAAAQTKKVNLNTATEAELDGLPQIGPARAKAIIEARNKAKFKNWDDFVARNVVPKNAETAIKDRVSF
jgi:competence protein ComEA